MGHMSHYTSPVPVPAHDAAPAEIYREIYGMPMFVNVQATDLAAARDFWIRGLGFIDLFTIPDRLTHLRRWAFQDVLLHAGADAQEKTSVSVSFSCVLSQLDEIATRCEELLPGCTTGPRLTPWNARELEVVTPENTRVIMTAARPLDPDSAEAANLRAVGIVPPEA